MLLKDHRQRKVKDPTLGDQWRQETLAVSDAESDILTTMTMALAAIAEDNASEAEDQ
ncbi:hypothetical protein [Nodosilinea sp. P-1105]|uniref:hypothetical protein n=1 Tax=Nodosilinea sp. P-1105 TaxID=2546229 RepID=UPI00146D3BBC|nr:hypothetical protein [Nodosilinea sp. P-1105]